jgi:hypothetical protein
MNVCIHARNILKTLPAKTPIFVYSSRGYPYIQNGIAIETVAEIFLIVASPAGKIQYAPKKPRRPLPKEFDPRV